MIRKKVVPSNICLGLPIFHALAKANSLVVTFAKCSPYTSSERTCNNELTLFVRVAVVLPLPTKPRALREPY